MDIEQGDEVRDKTGKHNNGLKMPVTGVREGQFRCDYFKQENGETIHKSEWIDAGDLILVEKPKGGFRDEGEGFED